jgi:cysteine desulfurase
MNRTRIYFDHAATTPLDPRVLAAMQPYWLERYGNPDSRTHAFGWEAEEGVEQAREEVASVLGAAPREIHFTSGATESINLALKGVLRAPGARPGGLVTTTLEHSAGMEAARALEREGVPVRWVRPDPEGRIAPSDLAPLVRPDTALVSILHGNNEVGVLQDLPALGAFCADRGVPLHVDATQSYGKVPIRPLEWGISFLSCSAHKIHGPKGAGALFVRRKGPHVPLVPLLHGGAQEGGMRAGTLNVPALVGFGRAAALCRDLMATEGPDLAVLRDRLEDGLLAQVPGARRNGPAEGRLPGITSLYFEGVDGTALLLGLRSVALSLGSACASADLQPSHVLLAMGCSETVSRNSVRFSLGRFNTVEEVDFVIQELRDAIARLRADAAVPRG